MLPTDVTIVAAIFTTAHFNFVALGTNRDEALAAARAAWDAHCAQYSGAEPRYFESVDIDIFSGRPGAGFRDDQMMTGEPEPGGTGTAHTVQGSDVIQMLAAQRGRRSS